MTQPISPNPAAKPRIEALRATPAHADAMAEFFRAVWDPAATGSTVRADRRVAALKNPAAGGEEPPTFLVLSDGKVIGYVSTIPGRLASGATDGAVHWIKGLMVLPEHRNGPVGFLVLKEAVRQLDCSLSLAVAAPARRLFTALGFTDLGPVPNRLRLLAPGRVSARLDLEALGLGGLPRWLPLVVRAAQATGLARLGGSILGLGLGAWAGLRAPGTRAVDVRIDAPFEAAEVTALWHTARAGIGTAAVRDGPYFQWRYLERRAADGYRIITARERGALRGIAAVRPPGAEGDPRLKGLRVATLADILYPTDRPDVGVSLIRVAERTARADQSDALLCGASHPALLTLFGRRGWLKVPGNIHLLARDLGGRMSLPPALRGWWITRGDGDSDGVL